MIVDESDKDVNVIHFPFCFLFQAVVAALSKNYDNFTSILLPNKPNLESVLPAYEEWKVGYFN